jgi:geranylgeranyl diphosphate synthase type I
LKYLFSLLNRVVQDTLAGQIIDVQVSFKPLQETSEQSILDIMTLKTAKYTLVAPLQFGAILANASQTNIEDIPLFGIPFGLAFQISDDIIGTFGKEEKTGKSINSDLKEGKKTFFIIDAYKKCNNDEKNRIETILGSENLSDDQYNQIREYILKYDSLSYTKKKIENFAQQGQKMLEGFKGHSGAKKILNEFAFNQINRMS